MPTETSYFRLTKIGPGEAISANNYAFTQRDRDKIDVLLYKGAVGHLHTGEDGGVDDPIAGPSLGLSVSGGSIPAGTTVRYKITYVTADGLETAASPESTITTPAAVSSPGAPTLTIASTGGTLLPGNYFYALTAYVDVNTNETREGARAYVTVISGSTNAITLLLPSLPSGATGFNVYRRGPGELQYSYLESIDMSVATPPTTYEDDGGMNPNCNRFPPRINVTNSSNAITISIPGATPVVPDGLTWKIYRTYTVGNYNNSLLVHVVEETEEGSGVITTSYTDVGSGTVTGSPPSTSEIIGNPSKIDLDDAAEVQGYLPPIRNHIPHVVTFAQSGVLEEGEGEFLWVCEFDDAEIQYVRCALGRNSVASSDVIVDVNKYDAQAATPSWDTIYTTQSARPKVLAGETIGDTYGPDVYALARGDALTIDIDDSGNGATPTAENLTVSIYMIVRGAGTLAGEDETDTYEWG